MKKFMAFLIGVALISIMLTGVIPNQAEAEEDNTKNVDVAIVLDNSGSMDAPGRWDNATEAAKGFISKLKSGDRCCIFCFNPDSDPDEPMMLMGFTSTNDAGIQSLNGAIDGLDPEGFTPLFDTIGDAMDYVVNNKRADSVGAIVALTDGLDNVCYEFYPSHDYREEKIVNEPSSYYSDDWGPSDTRIGLLNCSQATFIIGLDLGASSTYEEQLQDIAESSSGAYYSAAEGVELDAIYNQIAEKIEGKRSEGGTGELPWLWILIIVIIVAVAAIIAVLLLRRKKAPMGSAPGPQQQQAKPPNVPVCPICGGQLRFIPQYNRHWCDGCQKYK